MSYPRASAGIGRGVARDFLSTRGHHLLSADRRESLASSARVDPNARPELSDISSLIIDD